ncbi:hypothetical protein C8Q76DRAFT_748315 [Earliella scabrosa]|nr:hypothetical protein C8Q76DRAFT_748315 [Earliella scabrosa]
MRLHRGPRRRGGGLTGTVTTSPSICSISLPYRAYPNMSLLEFPDELMIVILLACEVGVLFTCKRVCRRLEGLIRSDVSLQYKIELAINGMIDGPLPPDHPRSVPLIGRLQQLRDCNQRFRTGSFHHSGREYLWQKVPGVADTPTDGWNAFLAFGSAISYVVVKPPQQEISICAPPVFGGSAGQPGSEMRSWRVPFDLFPPEAILGVSVDVRQDLLLVCQPVADSCDLSVHLRQLNNPANAHANAEHPVLFVTPSEEHQTPTDGTTISAIQIHGPLVGWLLHRKVYYLHYIEIWDWQAGHALWRCEFEGRVTFAFLDVSRILVASPSLAVLLIYDISLESPTMAGNPGSMFGRFQLLLDLPPADPVLAGAQIQESCIPASTSRWAPFWPDPGLSMAVVALSTGSVLLIPHQNIHLILAQASTSLSGRRVAWENWGPQNSLQLHKLLLPGRAAYRRVYSYGSRIAYFLSESVWTDSERTGIAAVVLDLNPWAARYAKRFPPRRSQEEIDTFVRASQPGGKVLPHVASHLRIASLGLAYSAPTLAMDHMGFTTMHSQHLALTHFFGTISYYT